MPRPRSADTRERIQAAAMDLFSERGIQQTSLQDIANRLGITKPALYYHFDSREDLVRTLVQPLIDSFETFISSMEAAAPVEPRRLLADYFDMAYRNRDISEIVVRDLSTLTYLDLGPRFIGWRTRLMHLLVGPSPSLSQQVAGIVAIGGMADATVMFPDVPAEDLRAAAVDAACATLGLP
jgi:AcrR family transcriptional regulator